MKHQKKVTDAIICIISKVQNHIKQFKKNTVVKRMLAKFDLQHFCCGPKGCELEIVYGEMIDAEE